MADKLKILMKLKNAMVRFVSSIIAQYPEDQEFIFVKTFIENHMPIEEIMGRFIAEILIDRKNVERRYDGFFHKHDGMNKKGYGEDWELSNNLYRKIKSIYLSEDITDDQRESCWKWFELFIKIADAYYIKFGEVKGWEVDHTHPVFAELDKKRSEYRHSNKIK